MKFQAQFDADHLLASLANVPQTIWACLRHIFLRFFFLFSLPVKFSQTSSLVYIMVMEQK